MKINSDGLSLIKSFEGCRLKAYKDAVGILTIGYGDTHNVIPNQEITQDEADVRLMQRLEEFEKGVSSLVKVSITENQFSALISFAYNLGLGNLKISMLLRCINKHNNTGAADEFLKWTKAGGRELSGLVRRRRAERDLFLKDL